MRRDIKKNVITGEEEFFYLFRKGRYVPACVPAWPHIADGNRRIRSHRRRQSDVNLGFFSGLYLKPGWLSSAFCNSSAGNPLISAKSIRGCQLLSSSKTRESIRLKNILLVSDASRDTSPV